MQFVLYGPIGNIQKHCSPCYSREVNLDAYNYKINLVPTHNEGVESKFPKIQPPKYHKQTGRQRKQRRKAVDEPKNPFKASRKGGTVTRVRCLTIGHNSRSCRKPYHPNSKMFKSKPNNVETGTSSQAPQGPLKLRP